MVRVLVGGVFDLIHLGHCYFLKKAAEMGDELIVVVATDETARKNGKNPLFTQDERKLMVEQIKHVDRAVIGFDDEDFIKIVEIENPDIIALGPDQKFEELGKKLKERGIDAEIRRITDRLEGYATSEIIRKIKNI